MTARFYKKYGWILVSTALIAWTILTPSHFQKGGAGNGFHFKIALFVTAISVLISIRFDNFHWAERILISIPFAFISLFFTAIIIGPVIVKLLYSDKTWFLWETKHRLIINSIFYGLNAAILTLLSVIYFKLRRQMKTPKNNRDNELKE